MNISKRAQNISPSATLAVGEKARELRQQGKEIVNLSAGEPDFDTPEDVKRAGIKALDEGLTKYTNTTGIDELKEAIQDKFSKDNSISYSFSEITACAGAKQALYNTLSVLCDEGEEVVVPTPCWVSYIEQIKLVGATPIFVNTDRESEYIPRAEDIEAHITPRTKALIINTPNNPTGAVYPKELLEEISKVVKRNNIWLISDEVYEKLVFDGTCHYSVVTLDPEMKDFTIVVNAVSKTYSMTGWRLGYAAGPERVIKVIGSLQSHTTGNPANMSQKAAAHALRNNMNYLEWVDEFDRRRRYVLERLNNMPGMKCSVPRGAFYVFPDASGVMGKSREGQTINNSLDLAAYFLEEAQVALVPGEAFAAQNHLRISYVNSMEQIEKGLDNMARALQKLFY